MRQLQSRPQVNIEYQETRRQWKKMRNAIRRTIEQYPDWTNVQISKELGCSDRLVGRVRGSVKKIIDEASQEQRRKTLVRLIVGYQALGMSIGKIASEFTRMKIPTIDLRDFTWTTKLIKALIS
jgi:hypothetical protein